MSAAGATIVIQTSPASQYEAEFAAWQHETSRVIQAAPGFVRQTVIPPSPPTQVDWVILQHFDSRDDAATWLRSDARQGRVAAIQHMVTGHDDVHIVAGDGNGGGSPVSAVISTRVRPGQEAAYRRWEQRIAAAQARAPGFQGYRLEPPIPKLQEDWLAIVKFDGEAALQAWLDSPERAALLADSTSFTDSFHTRVARTGFDQWFDVTPKPGAAEGRPPAWKQNMVVLLVLYPIVFLFGTFVMNPLLLGRAHLPFAVALFTANVASILLMNDLVPWSSRRFAWWLRPGASALGGAAVLLALYAALVGVFTWFF